MNKTYPRRHTLLGYITYCFISAYATIFINNINVNYFTSKNCFFSLSDLVQYKIHTLLNTKITLWTNKD